MKSKLPGTNGNAYYITSYFLGSQYLRFQLFCTWTWLNFTTLKDRDASTIHKKGPTHDDFLHADEDWSLCKNLFKFYKVHSNLSACLQNVLHNWKIFQIFHSLKKLSTPFLTAKCYITFCYVSCICDKWRCKGHFLLEMRAIYRHRKVCKSSDLSKMPCIISHKFQSLCRI